MVHIPQPGRFVAWGDELRFALSQVVSAHMSLLPTLGPLHLWKQFANAFDIDSDIQEAVAEELRSSITWQRE